MKNEQIFRLNWNRADFKIEIFEEAYKKGKGLMVWRHFSAKHIDRGTKCILWFGMKGRTKKTKPLEGIAGIGEVIKNDTSHRFSYLDELKPPKMKEHYVEVKLRAVTDVALVSRDKIESLFKREIKWISGTGKSDYVNEEYSSDAKELYDMAEAEYNKRSSK